MLDPFLSTNEFSRGKFLKRTAEAAEQTPRLRKVMGKGGQRVATAFVGGNVCRLLWFFVN